MAKARRFINAFATDEWKSKLPHLDGSHAEWIREILRDMHPTVTKDIRLISYERDIATSPETCDIPELNFLCSYAIGSWCAVAKLEELALKRSEPLREYFPALAHVPNRQGNVEAWLTIPREEKTPPFVEIICSNLAACAYEAAYDYPSDLIIALRRLTGLYCTTYDYPHSLRILDLFSFCLPLGYDQTGMWYVVTA